MSMPQSGNTGNKQSRYSEVCNGIIIFARLFVVVCIFLCILGWLLGYTLFCWLAGLFHLHVAVVVVGVCLHISLVAWLHFVLLVGWFVPFACCCCCWWCLFAYFIGCLVTLCSAGWLVCSICMLLLLLMVFVCTFHWLLGYTLFCWLAGLFHLHVVAVVVVGVCLHISLVAWLQFVLLVGWFVPFACCCCCCWCLFAYFIGCLVTVCSVGWWVGSTNQLQPLNAESSAMQQRGLSFHQGLHTPVYILSVRHRQVKEAMSYSLRC